MNPDGSNVLQLTNNPEDEWGAALSPDGTRIAYQKEIGDQSEIYVMAVDGSGQARLTNDASYDASPSWSPDNAKLAFSSDRGGIWHIWVMNALDGSGQYQLNTTTDSYGPAWSPNGTQIAYDAENDGDGWTELWLMNSDGSNQHKILDPSGSTDVLARNWSPDGNFIVFQRISYVEYQGDWYWTNSVYRCIQRQFWRHNSSFLFRGRLVSRLGEL